MAVFIDWHAKYNETLYWTRYPEQMQNMRSNDAQINSIHPHSSVAMILHIEAAVRVLISQRCVLHF